MSRLVDVKAFYALLATLEQRLGGKRTLSACTGRMQWPERGVYFFFEPGQFRSDSGDGLRVVRVGTHATTEGAKSRLWRRLAQHRGHASCKGGNHRGSIMRLLVGVALGKMTPVLQTDSWGNGQDPTKAARKAGSTTVKIRLRELALEAAVSEYIGAMPFLWIDVGDAPNQNSDRGLIERNCIGLLSNQVGTPIDPASKDWLGSFCDRERVRRSGLWNNNHVDEIPTFGFLDTLERYVNDMVLRL
jgi:hypothetical protein